MSKYPIGATWQCVGKQRIGLVWLESRDGKLEFWNWCSFYTDRSGVVRDWSTTKAAAVYACKQSIPSNKLRFIRQKGESDHASQRPDRTKN